MTCDLLFNWALRLCQNIYGANSVGMTYRLESTEPSRKQAQCSMDLGQVGGNKPANFFWVLIQLWVWKLSEFRIDHLQLDMQRSRQSKLSSFWVSSSKVSSLWCRDFHYHHSDCQACQSHLLTWSGKACLMIMYLVSGWMLGSLMSTLESFPLEQSIPADSQAHSDMQI